MGEHKKEGRVKKSRILLIKSELGSEIIPGVIEGMDLIHPEGFLVEGIESEGKSDEKAEHDQKNFFSPCNFWD
jgi:hypothetical protein